MTSRESEEFSQDERDEILISAVRMRPALFDSRDKNFKNAKFKENAWSSVGDLLGVNGEEARRRWLLIKNNFTKYCRRKKAENRSGAGAVLDKLPPLYQMMTWYLKYSAVKRRTTSNFSRDEDMPDTQSSETSIWDTPLWDNESNRIVNTDVDSNVSDVSQTAVNTTVSVSPAGFNSGTRQPAGINGATTTICSIQNVDCAAGPSGNTGANTSFASSASVSFSASAGSCASAGSAVGSDNGMSSAGIVGSSRSAAEIRASARSPAGSSSNNGLTAGYSGSVAHNQNQHRINPPPQNFVKKKKDDLVPIFTQGMKAFTQYVERGSQSDPHMHHFVGYASALLKNVPDDLRLECEERVLAVIKSYIP